MIEVNELALKITQGYSEFLTPLPSWAQTFVNMFLVVVIAVTYSFFTYKVYMSLSRKNIFGLDLNKYNQTHNPFFTKVIAGLFYFIEYIFILPFVIFFWFAIFALFLILLTDNIVVNQILVISAVIIVVIRIAAYYERKLAEELGKLIPFTLLAVCLITPEFFNFQRIIPKLNLIPAFLNQVSTYLLFIMAFEIILRIFDFFFSLFGFEKKIQKQKEKDRKLMRRVTEKRNLKEREESEKKSFMP
jgi:hypothetical protein